MGGRGGPLWQRISYRLPPPPFKKPAQAPSEPLHLQWEQPHSCAEPQQQKSIATGSDLHGPSPVQESVSDVTNTSQLVDGNQASSVNRHQVNSVDSQSGILTVEDATGHITQQQTSVWDFLRDQLRSHQVQIDQGTAQQLPFDFWGGFVGYLGYELKAECGGDNVHQAPTPDAAMFLADR